MTVTEPQLRSIPGRFTYNSRGFILIEWGTRGQHHFRLDLQRFGALNRYQCLSANGRDYEYQVASIHLKQEVQYAPRRDWQRGDPTEDAWNYFYVTYVGGGVWQPVWGYYKAEHIDTRETRRLNTTSAEQGEGFRLTSDLLADLAKATGTPQAIACGPLASPSRVPGGIIPG